MYAHIFVWMPSERIEGRKRVWLTEIPTSILRSDSKPEPAHFMNDDCRLQCSVDTVVCAEWHPLERNQIVSCGKGHVSFWSLDNGGMLYKRMGIFESREKPRYVTCVAFNQSGDVLTGDSNGNIIVWGRGKRNFVLLFAPTVDVSRLVKVTLRRKMNRKQKAETMCITRTCLRIQDSMPRHGQSTQIDERTIRYGCIFLSSFKPKKVFRVISRYRYYITAK